jgi:hypothetical protein
MARTTMAGDLLLLVVLALALGRLLGGAEAQAQAQPACAAQLGALSSCARYSVPPAPGQPLPAPGQECCSALGAVTRDCACGALGIITSLPTKCGLPRVSCRT